MILLTFLNHPKSPKWSGTLKSTRFFPPNHPANLPNALHHHRLRPPHQARHEVRRQGAAAAAAAAAGRRPGEAQAALSGAGGVEEVKLLGGLKRSRLKWLHGFKMFENVFWVGVLDYGCRKKEELHWG